MGGACTGDEIPLLLSLLYLLGWTERATHGCQSPLDWRSVLEPSVRFRLDYRTSAGNGEAQADLSTHRTGRTPELYPA